MLLSVVRRAGAAVPLPSGIAKSAMPPDQTTPPSANTNASAGNEP